MTDTDDIDDLVASLRASGWDRITTTGSLAQQDFAVAKSMVGETNARRMVATPRGARLRMVRTSEVYVVRNSRGWLVGAIEGKRNRPLYDGLTTAERDRVVNFARERGFHVVVHANPAPPREVDLDPMRRADAPRPRSAERSRRFDLINQLRGFRA